MIVPIIIDTTALVDAYSSITHGQIDDICDNIAKSLSARYAQQLEHEANLALNQTKRRYVQAINVVDSGRLEGTVILDFSKDPVVKMIEQGASPFDMKRGMLNSSKVKISLKGGRYITVPFRIGTPGTKVDSDVFSGKMPSSVYKVAKSLTVNLPSNRSAGIVQKDLPKKYQSPSKRSEITDSEGKVLFKEYIHKSSKYVGIVKNRDSVTGQNIYNSFRRVSDQLKDVDGNISGSDPDSWIHKGIEQYNLVSKALSSFNTEIEVSVALNNELEKLGLL